jgi:cellulose synthase/poly-beta-1,6-N-acetylglucosamine synthase-like glycosyltransferase
MTASILFILYLSLGPIAFSGLIVGFYLGRSRMARLAKTHCPQIEHPPQVTIVIPAKDEASRICECVEAVLGQDYPSFSVLVIDDRSEDETGRILDALVVQHPGRLCVHHVDTLPEGWLGKCHALYVGTRAAKSPWLLFVDSDVTLQPSALRDTLALALSRNYDAISLLTRIEGRTFWERLMIPISAATWAVMFLVSLTNNDRYPKIAAANGQFFLIRREAYESVGGHGAVKMQIVEDVELMRLLKSRGFACRLYIGSHLATTRMHETLKQLRSGWGRIFAGTNRFRMGRLIAAMVCVLFGGLSAYPAIGYGLASRDRGWMIASLIHLTMITFYLGLVYRAAGSRVRYALLFPLSGAVLMNLLWIGVRRCTHRHFEWRGTRIVAAGQ